MSDVYLVGGFATPFGKKPDQSYKDLTREAYLGVLADAQMPDGRDIEFVWFGNCSMYLDGQGSIRGQVCLTPLVRDGLFPERAPIANVENACATSSTALHAACQYVKAGDVDLALVLGVEKLYRPKPNADQFEFFMAGVDQYDPAEWREYYKEAGERSGKRFETGTDRTVFMDTYAMQAAYHMKKYGTTKKQIALAAAKTHNFGADNPRAQYRFKTTVEEVMADRVVSEPLTRSMCAPIGDGAAGLLVCSEAYLRRCPADVQERAVKILACEMSSGKYRDLDESGLSAVAANRAYERAGVAAADIDVAEIHDATSFSEIYQSEMMGFCPEGEGGRFIESGKAGLGGKTAINTSGGLISKGHPVGATGASMTFELMNQLRGEAGSRQQNNARLGLAENGGGVIGFDEAACVVTILERA